MYTKETVLKFANHVRNLAANQFVDYNSVYSQQAIAVISIISGELTLCFFENDIDGAERDSFVEDVGNMLEIPVDKDMPEKLLYLTHNLFQDGKAMARDNCDKLEIASASIEPQ